MFTHTGGAYMLEYRQHGKKRPLLVGTQRLTGSFWVISRCKRSCAPTCPAVRPTARSARCTCPPPEVLFYLESIARMPHSEREWQHGAKSEGGALCITDASHDQHKVCQVVHRTLEGEPHIRVCSMAGETLVEMPVERIRVPVAGAKRAVDDMDSCLDLPALKKHVAKACSLEARDIRLITADGQLIVKDYVDPIECLPCASQTTGIGALGAKISGLWK